MFVFLSRSMLGRIVTRPAATLRRGSQLQRRFIHPSRPQLEAPPRPNTWLVKIRFRADGKPRSKIIALGFGEYPLINFFSILFLRKKTDSLLEGSIILFNLLLLRTLFVRFEYKKKTEILMTRLIFIQRTDSTYDSVNFDDPISNLAYFKKLYQSYSWTSDQEIDEMFTNAMEAFKMKTKEGSTVSAEAQALHIMRTAAEAIHRVLRKLNGDTFLDSAVTALIFMRQAMDNLLDLMESGDGGDTSKYNIKLMRKKNDAIFE